MINEERLPGDQRREAFRRFAPLLAVALLTVIFFIPWIFQGKVFLAADTLYSHLPWSAYRAPGVRPHNTLITDPVNMGYPVKYNQQVKKGDLKSWSPLIMGGLPAMSVGVTGGSRYYFLKYLYNRMFSTTTALMLLLLTHLLLMGVFMYLYLEEIGAGWRGALFGAAAWMFSGCTMVWFEFGLTVSTGAFIPLLLIVLERFLGARRYLFAFAGAMVLGMYMLTQHLQFLLYIGVLLIFYFFFLAWRLHRREPGLRPLGELVACFAITAVGALLIGAVEMIPMAEIVTNSGRIARTFDFRGLFDTLGRVNYRYLTTLIFPDYFGSPVLSLNAIPSLPQQEYMNYNELCLYLGVPTLFAFLAAAVSVRDAATRFWLFLTLLFASMMVGTYTFYPFFKWFPGLGRVNPTRIIFLFTLAATVTAGLGISALDGFSRARRRIFLVVASVLAAAALLLALVSVQPGVLAWFNSEFFGTSMWPYVSQTLSSMRSLASPIMLKPLLLVAGAFLLFSTYVLIADKRARLAIFSLTFALLAYDLISFGWYYNTVASPATLFAKTPGIDFLQKQGGVFRVVQDARKGFFFNAMAPFGIEDLGGYANLYPDRSNRLYSFTEFHDPRPRFDRWVGLSGNGLWNVYSLMNVRYYLTAPGAPPPSPDLRLVFRNEIDIYENTRALPRAFVVHRAVVERDVDKMLRIMASPGFNPGSTVILEENPPPGFAPAGEAPAPGRAAITRYDEDRIEIAADLPINGWLVVSNTYYPGWEATSDGIAVPLQRADCAIGAIPLSAGRHNVVFEYRPSSIAWGKVLSLLGIVLSLVGAAATGSPGLRARARTLLRGGATPPA